MRWKTSFQVSATYVGAVMGAGFASGQEIQQFFTRFGYIGIIGIFISSLLFALMGWGMLDLQSRWRISSYNEFFEGLLGKKLGLWADRLVSVLLFVGMVAMVSGSGAVFQEYFGFSRWIGIVLTCFIIVLALWYQGEGVLWINSVLIPLKFIFCLGIAASAIFLVNSGDGCQVVKSTNPIVNNWILSAILYVSFNLTLAMVVFASLGREIQKSGARLGGVLGGVALGLFAFAIGGALLRFPDVLGLEIPMVGIAGKLGDWPAFFYVVVLWLAMITAAVGNGFSLISRVVDSSGLSYGKTTATILLLLIPMSGVRFSQIVQLIYPLFGYIGLLFMPTIVYCWLKR